MDTIMSNLTVAVLAPPDYAKDLGKKGTTSDITFYNLKKGEAYSHVYRTDPVPGKIILVVLCSLPCRSHSPRCGRD